MNLKLIKNDIPKQIQAWANQNAESTTSKYASFLVLRYHEIVERVFAFRKYSKRGKKVVMITEVLRRDTSGKSVNISKNLTFAWMSGYFPIYERRDRYTTNGWGYRTFNKEWFDVWDEVYDNFLPPVRHVVNPEMLQKTEEFKYCGYTFGDVIKYLKMYRKNKGIEFMGKLGIPLSAALIRKCEKSKEFRSFLYRNHGVIPSVGVKCFIYSYDHKLTFEQAKIQLQSRRDIKLEKAFEQATQKASALKYQNKTLTVFPAEKLSDLVKEGMALSHCVGNPRMGYGKKHAEGKSVILFVRYLDNISQPLVTVEYCPISHKILQSYGSHNSKPNADVQQFLQDWQQIIASVQI